MKDKKAREDVFALGERVFKLESSVFWLREARDSSLGDVSLKDCPKCKHRVLAVMGDTVTSITPRDHRTTELYQCLTCGSRFTCTEKCVSELLEG